MQRFVHLLDRLIDAGLIAVLVFTPLAFGAVEEWARALGQIAIWLVFAAWICKVIWTPRSHGRRGAAGAILGGRVRLSGLELPGLLFVAVLLLQLLPLPPQLVRTISPKTAEIYSMSLPGYGQQDSPTFAGLPGWLQRDAEPKAGDVAAIPSDPEAAALAFPPEWFEVSHSAWRPLSLTPSDTRRALSVFLAHLALLIVAFNQLGQKNGATRFAMALGGLAGLLAGIGILQSLSADGRLYWWRGGGPQQGFGPFVNANNFAGWMEMALPLAAALLLTYWIGRPGRRRGRPSAAGIVLFGFMTILGFAAFVLARSRGGFLALLGAMALAFMLYAIKGRVRTKTVILGLIPVLLALGLAAWIDMPGLTERYATLGDVREERSFTTRMAFSKRALEIAKDFPLLGSGMGTFRETHYLYTPGTSSHELVRAHNDYAQLAAECGLLGIAAMLWALVVLVSRGVIGGLLRPPNASGWVVRAAAIGVLALLLHSFVDFNLQIYSNSLLFVFLCAVLMRDAAEARDVERSA
jgi:O-antigen ligase